jgi:hypothetical protein
LHVLDLSIKMTNGLFRFGEIGFAVMNGTKDILINGQHVCSAVVESGITVPCILERFNIKNDIELSEAFRQFEILPRSLSDMVKVEANALRLTWPLRISSLIVSAAAIEVGSQKKLGTLASPGSVGGRKSFTKTSKYMSKDDKVKLLKLYLNEGAFLYSIVRNTKTDKHLMRSSVALIMIQTWRKDHDDAYRFWTRVRDGENLTRDMPEMRLREFLIETRVVIKQAAYMARHVKPHEYAYRCASAWNAFRTNRPTRLSYYPDKAIPSLK